jgi:hypothetical protein
MRHRQRLFLVISMAFSSVVCAGGQPAPSGALSAELRSHVRDEQFQIVTSIRGMPLGVRDALQSLFGSQTLDIAEPGARFQVNERSVSNLPTRRMIAAGCSYDHCLVYYERGGAKHTWHVALFHWSPDATKFEWGSTAPAGLAKIDDVRSAILAGTIKGPAGAW